MSLHAARRPPATVIRARVMLMIAACLLAALTPLAVADGHGLARLLISARTAPAGGTLQVAGMEMDPSQPVRLELLGSARSWPLGQAAPDASGAFTTTIQLPADLPPGRYEVRAALSDGDFVTAQLEVQAAGAVAPPSAPAGSGPPTGGTSPSGTSLPVIPLVLFAGGLAFVIAAFVYRSRREAGRSRQA